MKNYFRINFSRNSCVFV